jgi:very-short-patch-repair endonuclease
MDQVDIEARLRAAEELRQWGESEAAEFAEANANPSKLWELIIRKLQSRVTPYELDTYFLSARGISLTDTLLIVEVPSQDSKDWLLHTVGDDLRPILQELGFPNVNVSFRAASGSDQSRTVTEAKPQPRIHIDRALERWKTEMLDLSRSNRLLYARPGRTMLELTHPDVDTLFDALTNHTRPLTIYRPERETDGPTAAENLELLLQRNGTTVEVPEDGETVTQPQTRPPRQNEIVIEGEPKNVTASLYRLRLKARSALQEQGVSILYAAFGTLEWTDDRSSSDQVVSPLVLVAVRLEQETALSAYTLIPLDEEPVFNPALARKMDAEFGIEFTLPPIDEKQRYELDPMLKTVREAIRGQPAWNVRAAAYLGLFSFAKQALYTDLEQNRERFAHHPVLRSISGEITGVPTPLPTMPKAENLDRDLAPHEIFQVLDADASQREAIAAVQAGANLVIQGPPGTGKSQTIANIISEFLGRGKTVLFVSEKMAALKVVARRLDQAGLSEFCLEAHSQDMQKERVVRDLERALLAEHGEDTTVSDERIRTDLDRLAEVRTHLNNYVAALHATNNPLGVSAYEVHGELASRSAPLLSFRLDGIETMSHSRLSNLESIITRLMAVGHVFLAADQHPWAGCTIGVYSPSVHATLQEQFERVDDAASRLRDEQSTIRSQLGLAPGESMEDATWLRDLVSLLDHRANVPRHWLTAETIDAPFATAELYRQRMADYRTRRAALLDCYDERIFALDLDAIVDGFSEARAATWTAVRGEQSPMNRAAEAEERVEPLATATVESVTKVLAASEIVASLLGVDSPQSVSEARWLESIAALVSGDPRPTPAWFEPGRIAELRALVAEAMEHQTTIRSLVPVIEARFTADFFEQATPGVLELLETDYNSWTRGFKPGYRRVAKRAKAALLQPTDFSYADLTEMVRTALRVTKSRAWFSDQRDRLVSGFGSHFEGLDTDWAATDLALESIRHLHSCFGGERVPDRTREVLLGQHGGSKRVAIHARGFTDAVESLSSRLSALNEKIEIGSMLRSALGVEGVTLEELAESIRTWHESIRVLWASCALMRSCHHGTEFAIDDLAREARETWALRTIETDLESASEDLQAEFGSLFTGLDTKWADVLDRLGWTAQIRNHFGAALPLTFVDSLERGEQVERTVQVTFSSHLQELEHVLAQLRAQFRDDTFMPDQHRPSAPPLSSVASWARDKRSRLSQLEEWCDLTVALAEAQAAGLGESVDALSRKRPPTATWLDAFLCQFYAQWLTWRYSTSEPLARFRGKRHQEHIQEFRRLDRWQWYAASQRITRQLRDQRPRASLNMPRKSEPAILLHEASKRKRFRPLRKLFADLPNLLPALKPCLLMSPLAVAQYLGESPVEFDVVIFDEASQILPADAVGAIGRGGQVVVVGDQKQLPPTRFFSVDIQIEEDDEDEELAESILDRCIGAGVPQKRLLWHYRSRHEELIAFSNRHFYDQQLVTFPSPDADSRAVHFVHVPDGSYSRSGTRVNLGEANRLVDLVLEQVRSDPSKSVGVITFSEAQMVAIEAEIDRRKRDDASLEDLLRENGPDGFFVKNLENVQGDERDLIYFSVGYGPDADGKMTMNFGPLNREGGERRLNVAVTRARHEVQILASFRPEDIDLGRTKAKGVHLLREYLSFAEHGASHPLAQPPEPAVGPPKGFEEVVTAALGATGLRVVPQVGIGQQRVDFGLKPHGGDRFVLGVECDGATYRLGKTARDRDRLRDEVLTNLGWKLHRIWSTDWIKDPAREIEAVLSALKADDGENGEYSPDGQMISGPITTDDTGNVETASDEPDENGSGSEAALAERKAAVLASTRDVVFGETYRYVILPERRHRPQDLEWAPVWYVANFVQEIVLGEGPVHAERVIRALATVWSVGRVTTRTRPFFMRAISAAIAGGMIVQRGDFLWVPKTEVPVVRSVDERGNVRRVQEIAPEEIEQAVLAVLKTAFAMARENLAVSVARGLGYERTGIMINAAIAAAIESLLAARRIVLVGDQIRAS